MLSVEPDEGLRADFAACDTASGGSVDSQLTRQEVDIDPDLGLISTFRGRKDFSSLFSV